MMTNRKHIYKYVPILLFLLGGTPLLFYWIFIGRAPSVSVGDAHEILSQGDPKAILVDVRNTEEFTNGHIAGSFNSPYKQILAYEHIASATVG
jgi:hypothetical protein